MRPFGSTPSSRRLAAVAGAALLALGSGAPLPAQSAVFPAVADTYIVGHDPGANFDQLSGDPNSRLLVRSLSDPVRANYAYIRFDLRGVASIEPGARLALTIHPGNTQGWSDTQLEVYGLPATPGLTRQDWAEQGLTWNTAGGEFLKVVDVGIDPILRPSLVPLGNLPASNGAPGSDVVLTGAALDGFLASRLADGGLVTIVLGQRFNANRLARFDSREAGATGPRLVVVPGTPIPTDPREIFVAPGGSDANPGTLEQPLATFNAAHAAARPGDTVVLRGGTYLHDNDDIAVVVSGRAYVHNLDKDGIRYVAYPGERPILDYRAVRPTGQRVIAMHVSGDDLLVRGLDLVGVQVTITAAESANTQSEYIRVNGGNRNRFENLRMRDGMGIGFYLSAGADNLVLNCDAFNNVGLDVASTGNVDGFGVHTSNPADTGNRIVGCRAWFNSDDGFDLINCSAPVVIEHCWAFWNGFDASFTPLRDGHGFKAGGYGRDGGSYPVPTPRHVVRYSLAVRNKTSGFYANHHIGGLDFHHNTAVRNPVNFNLLSALADNLTNVPGYADRMRNNLAVEGRTELANLDVAASDVAGNWFNLPVVVDAADCESLDEALLSAPRQPNGDLPVHGYARLRTGSDLVDAGVAAGFGFRGAAPDLGAFESRPPGETATAVARFGAALRLRWEAPVGRPFVVLESADPGLPSEQWTERLRGAVDGSGLVVVDVEPSADAGFWRLRIEP